jgi:zinc protease
LVKAKKNLILGLAGQWETTAAVADSLERMVRYGYPEDYYAALGDKIDQLSLADISSLAGRILHPENLTWIVVGDCSKLKGRLGAQELGELRQMNPDGEPEEL